MRIVLVGSNGQLASSLKEALARQELLCFSHQQLDITDEFQVREIMRKSHPDVVINSVAIRKPDECERDPVRAFLVNALGARNLALSCAEEKCVLVQVSTDNVFDGTKNTPYLEEDRTNPITAYGVSKLAGEFFVKNLVEKHYIVRTSALFGGENNFVLMMLKKFQKKDRIQVVTDQRVSPTYTLDLARGIAELIQGENYGTYHMSNAGGCSWYEFACAIFEIQNMPVDIFPIKTSDLELASSRLKNAELGHDKLEDLPTWRNALERYLCTVN